MVEAMHPLSVYEAVAMLAAHGTRAVAGATDWMRTHAAREIPVFLDQIESMQQVWDAGDALHIGACCTFTRLLDDARVPSLLHSAMRGIASPAIRNRGTIGGNIISASPSADTLPPLYAMDAKVLLISRGTARMLPIEDFITGDNQTMLRQEELLTEVIVPLHPHITRFEKVAAMPMLVPGKCSFAGMAYTSHGILLDLRAAFGGAGKTVMRSRSIEQRVHGTPLCEIPAQLPALLAAYSALLSSSADTFTGQPCPTETCLGLLEAFINDIII